MGGQRDVQNDAASANSVSSGGFHAPVVQADAFNGGVHTYYGASPHTGLPPVTDWPLLDAADPIAFGVRPTRKFADEATLPPYVARDGDALLERRMSAAAEAGGLVLVTGAPLSPRRRGREPGGGGLQGETAGAHQGSARYRRGVNDSPAPRIPEHPACPHSTTTPESGPALFTWEFATDPYPAYAWLREHRPVHRTSLPSGVEAWLVTRYADARQALADARLSKNPANHAESPHAKGKTGIPGERKAELMTHLLNIDPPDHTRLRRLVSKAFTPRRVAEFAPRVQELTDRLIDRFIEDGEADLIHDLAFPLPIYAICDLLGVPREDQDDFRDWAGMMIRHGGGPRGGVARSVKKMRGYLAELIHRKRENPGDDLISGLIRASDHGEHLTENEAAAMAFILLFAGFETTVNLIGNGMYALLRHPEQRARLEASLAAGESGLLATGIEELLRYDGPVEMATWRYATEPLTLGGEEIAAGDPVLVVLAAADRDPERFEDPDTLDLARRDNQHLGYGHGIHYCLGAPLARLEGQAALATLLRRLPGLRLAADPADLRWRGGLIMRGLRTLPVAFEPGSRTEKGDLLSTL